MDWYQLTTEETIQKLGTDPESGLTSPEVQQRLAEFGPEINW